MSKKKLILSSDLLKEITELFFYSPCKESVEKNVFSLATITVCYFFLVQKVVINGLT